MDLTASSRHRCVKQRHLVYTSVVMQVMTILLQVVAAEYSSMAANMNRSPRHIKIATLQTDPFVRLNWSPGLIANERYEGLYIDLLKELAREVGFTYQLYLVPDGKTGQLGENGHWNGLIGELERGSADLALAPVIATDERRHVVHFLSPLSRAKLSLLSRDHHGQRHLPYGLVLDSEEFYAIKTDTQLYNNLKVHGIVYTTSMMEALDKAREGVCNLILSAQMALYHSDQEPCDMTAEPFHIFDDLVYSLATSDHSEISDEISSALDRLMIGTSVVERLDQQWLRGACMRRGTLPTSLGTTTNANAQRQWKKLTITSLMMAPYLMRSNKRGVEFEGYIADLIHQMAQVLSIDYEWHIQRRVGRRKDDGSWTGMIGELMDGTADLAAAPFVVSDDQEPMLSFSKPFLESTLSLVIKSPGTGDPPSIMVEDLLNQSTYDFGIVHKSRLAKQLKNSQLPIYKQLWRKLKHKDRSKENRITSIRDGLRRVRQGEFALLMESTEATYFASQRPCDLLSLSQYLVVTNYAFATKKESPLMDHLNLALLQLQERGVLQALFHKWWNTDECIGVANEPDSNQKVATQNLPLSTTTVAQFKPILDFDLDALLGLYTDQYPYADNASDYDALEDSEMHDLERLFLTSPISPFTPRRSDKKDMASLSVDTVNLSTTTSTIFEAKEAEPPSRKDVVTRNNSANNSVSSVHINVTMATTSSVDPDSQTSTLTSLVFSSTKKPRRKGRTRRPGRRKGRKRSTTPAMTTTTIIATTTTRQTVEVHANTPRGKPRDFNRNIDWFFATELPRSKDYENYDAYNYSDSDNFTSFTSHRPSPSLEVNTHKYDVAQTTPRETSQRNSTQRHTTTTLKSATQTTVDSITIQTDGPVSSSAPPVEEFSSAVLFVVMMHLVIFGWPAEPIDCSDNCHR